MMDAVNVEYAILSISSPGVHLTPGDDAAAIDLCRKCNAFAAEMKKRRPKRFGYFASLPLPKVEASLKELDAALNEGADGITFMTNFHGVYLGDPRFDKVFDELNHRKARVSIHPTCGCFCPEGGSSAGTRAAVRVNPLSAILPNTVLEFFFDTSRCIANLFLSGTVRRCQNITWLIPHLGGSLPPLLSRFTGSFKETDKIKDRISEDEVVEIFNQRFFFDMAGWAFPRQWKMVVQGLGVSFDRLTYGSDFPFTDEPAVVAFADKMDRGTEEWTEESTEKAYFRNAAKLFDL
jgi:predicted TIM-barrel fold metal-dependent hydrolase